METPQDKINRLQKEIEAEQQKQKFCQHTFDKAVYDPESTTVTEINWSNGLIGRGSDPYYDTYERPITKPRWSRTCTKCGKIEYTYTQKVVHIDQEPEFH